MQYKIFAKQSMVLYLSQQPLKRPRLELLFRPHIHELQRRIGELNHMSGLQCFSVYVVNVVRMEDAGTSAVENGLFTRRISKTEAAPTVAWLVLQADQGLNISYLGCFVGAQTMAMLSGIMT